MDGKENEIKAAPRLLEAIDLRGKVVSGDAMLTQRQLSGGSRGSQGRVCLDRQEEPAPTAR